jgi:HlyD family secretion protein
MMDSTIAKKKPWSKAALLAVVTVGCFTFLFNVVGQSGASSFKVDSKRLTIATVTQGQFNDHIPVRGNIEPIKSVYLDAIEGGRVEQLFVEEGVRVVKGQKILELSNTNLQLDVISREAQISEQLNNLHNTRLAIDQNRLSLKRDLIEIDYQLQQITRKVKQNESLLTRKLISVDLMTASQQEHDYLVKRRALTIEQQQQDEKLRSAQIKQLESNVKQLNRNLSVTRKNLESLVVRAPVDGLLTALNAQMGESKARGVRLGQVDIVDQFKVTATVDEFYVNRVQTGQSGDFKIDGKSYQLTLSKVYSQIRGGQFEVDMAFTGDKPANIRRGQTLQVNLHLGESRSAMLVNNGGFYQDTGGQWAFVVTTDGEQAYRKEIKTGRRNNRHIEILSGLAPGDKVVVSSYGSFAKMDQLSLSQATN